MANKILKGSYLLIKLRVKGKIVKILFSFIFIHNKRERKRKRDKKRQKEEKKQWEEGRDITVELFTSILIGKELNNV